MINKCINFIQNIIFAQSCMNCRRPSDTPNAICRECYPQLPTNRLCCRQCALPLKTETSHLCGHCQKTPPVFDSAFIPFRYAPPIDQWIWKFKFRNDQVSGKLLADLFIKKWHESPATIPEILIPVPLHASRLRQRGFNQSLWLARYIGNQLGIKVDSRSVRRNLKTPPQHELNMQQRKTVLTKAFTLKGNIKYRHAAIVDDVLTSGSTVNEISKLLRSKGCATIDCWAIARTANRIKQQSADLIQHDI